MLQRVQEVLRGRETLIGIQANGIQQSSGQYARIVSHEAVRRRWIACANIACRFHERFASERVVTGRELIQDQAQSENIRAPVDGFAI
jgi:hypothetical protein